MYPEPSFIARRLGPTQCYKWGETYERGFWVRRNMTAALSWYWSAAKLGSVEAYLKLAEYYSTRSDKANAILCFEEAIKLGSHQGYMGLAQYYEKQKETTKMLQTYAKVAALGETRALQKLKSFAAGKDQLACYYLGRVYEQQQKWQDALKQYEIAASNGCVLAMEQLADFYQKDHPGIPQNFAMALLFYKQAILKDSKHASASLVMLAEKNGQAACALAQIYEESPSNPAFQGRVAAIKYYEKASLLGNAHASFRLAELSKDPARTCQYYQLAMTQQHPTALAALILVLKNYSAPQIEYDLALRYEGMSNFEQAVIWYKTALDHGHKNAEKQLAAIIKKKPECAHQLGELYFTSHLTLAIDYFIQAALANIDVSIKKIIHLAEQGNPEHQFKLAQNYYYVIKNHSKVAYWWMRAAQQGHAQAQQSLTSTAFDAKICIEIAQLYEQGEKQITRNLASAYTFYQKADQQGNLDACYKLAEMFEQGILVEKNLETALGFLAKGARKNHSPALLALTRLAESNFAQAQFTLGQVLLAHGDKTNQVIQWYIRASEQNHQGAWQYLTTTVFDKSQYMQLAMLYDTGSEKPLVAKNQEKAILFYIKASDAGDLDATYRLGELEEKRSPSPNLDKALNHYGKAMQGGHVAAKKSVTRLAKLPHMQACYLLSELEKKNNLEQSLRWSLCAASLGHLKSKKYFESAELSGEQAWLVAQALDTGNTGIFTIQQEPAQAVRFYACVDAKNKHYTQACLRLAQLYETGAEGVAIDKVLATGYFIKAAYDPNNENALQKAESLVAELKNPALTCALGDCYKLNNPQKSIRHYKWAADQNYTQALVGLSALAQTDGEHAFKIGQLYESEDLEQAFKYYQLALMKDHAECLTHMENMATQDPQAMYILACHYYIPHQQTQKAVDVLMIAVALNHEPLTPLF